MILENLKIYTLNLQGTNIVGNFSRINCKIKYVKNWQTARILKHEEYKKSNYIKALKYQSEETRLYKEKLYINNKWYKNLNNVGDIISIGLSSLYSSNGQNWIKSFYTLYYFLLYFLLYPITFHVFLYLYALLFILLFVFYLIVKVLKNTCLFMFQFI